MNTGIGDAINLAWKLAAVLKGQGDESLLDSFEPERIGFARRLVATTDRMFAFVTAKGPLAWRFRTRLFPLLACLLFRLPGVRPFFFRTVSQTGIQYRKSPLSSGAAGSVRGGDRLPWIPIAPNQDNFQPLTSLAWHVHVYGRPGDRLTDACAELGLQLYAFAWTPEMSLAGLAQGALYLVRPDGYVALAVPEGHPEPLRRYLAALGWRSNKM